MTNYVTTNTYRIRVTRVNRVNREHGFFSVCINPGNIEE